MSIQNRITELTGAKYPIMQAPMGWIARSRLASAVCNAGGLGVIETSSGELDNIKREVAAKLGSLNSENQLPARVDITSDVAP